MDNQISLTKFMRFLAEMRAALLDVYIIAEKTNLFRRVSIDVIPFESNSPYLQNQLGTNSLTITFSVSAEFLGTNDPERRALGVSLMLSQSAESWIIEAQIGWSGKEIGWDAFDEKVISSDNVSELIRGAPSLIQWLERRFKDTIHIS